MPATQINRPDSSNKSFLHALLAAIIFMIFSAAILVSGFLAWHYPPLLAGSNLKPITLTGNDLFIAIGRGEMQGDKLILNELIEDGTAVISSRRTRFNASDYPILEYKITGRNPGTDVVLYWRTVTHNWQTLFAKMHWNSDYTTAYNLQHHPEWKGKITELGISIAGDLRKEPISIEQLTFSPLTVNSLLLTVWSEWNAFQGWTHKSINVIRGMPENALLSPVVAAAAWCGLAILLYTLWLFFFRTRKVAYALEVAEARRSVANTRHPDAGRNPLASPANKKHTALSITRQTWDFKAVVIMFMMAWFALDGKWQVNLWRQLGDTQYLFAGKTHHEQHLAAEDAELYAYAKRLKDEVLPEAPVRLFIVQNKWRDITRLKLLYYLLPHNIYNRGISINPNIIKDGDYILAINPSEGSYHSDNGTMLRYDTNRALEGTLMDKSRLGILFKAKSSTIFLAHIQRNHVLSSDTLAGRLMEHPVLVIGPPSFYGYDPGVPAINKGKNNRPQLRFQEWDYFDDGHTWEEMPVLAMEQGVNHMQDGSTWEIGTTELDHNSNPTSVQFQSTFPEPPRLFLMPQNSSDQTAISVRANRVTNTGFQLIATTQEATKNQLKPTTIGYIAIHNPDNLGTIKIENKDIAYRLVQAWISSDWQTMGAYDLFLQEEQSLDKETIHEAEQVDILEIDGYVFAQVVSNNEPDTVSLRMRRHNKSK